MKDKNLFEGTPLPKTVGELIDILSLFPSDAELQFKNYDKYTTFDTTLDSISYIPTKSSVVIKTGFHNIWQNCIR